MNMGSISLWIFIGLIGAGLSIYATARISQIISDQSTEDLKGDFSRQSETYQKQNSDLSEINEELNKKNLVLSKSIENLSKQNLSQTKRNLDKSISILNETKKSVKQLRQMKFSLENVLYLDMLYQVELSDADIDQIEIIIKKYLKKVTYSTNNIDMLPLDVFLSELGGNSKTIDIMSRIIDSGYGVSEFWVGGLPKKLAVNIFWRGEDCEEIMFNNPRHDIKMFFSRNPNDMERNPYYSSINYYPKDKVLTISINDFPIFIESTSDFPSKLDFKNCNLFKMAISQNVNAISYFSISDSKSRFIYANKFDISDDGITGEARMSQMQ